MDNELTFAARLVGQTVTDILNVDADRDGEITRQEVFALVAPLGMRLMTSIPKLNFAALAEEIKTSDTDARQAAVDAIRQSFDLADDLLEQIIEEVIEIIEDLYTDILLYGDRVGDVIEMVRARRDADA